MTQIMASLSTTSLCLHLLLLLLASLSLLSSSSLALPPPSLVVLCAQEGPTTNTHYLHPLSLSSPTKSPSPQNVTFSPSTGSHVVFTTDLSGWLAYPASSSLPTLPLLEWFLGDAVTFLSLDLHTLTPRLHWTSPVDDRMGGRFVYVNSSQSYWSVTAVNDIGSGPCIFVLSIFKDLVIPHGSPDKAVYSSSTSIGEDTAGIAGVAADARRHLLFVSISTYTFTGAVGSLQVFDTINGTLINDVQVAGAGTFGMYYSEARETLFTYRINDGNSQVIGIDRVDWKSGVATNIIPQSSLPPLYFFDKPISTAFDESSGEWYFAVQADEQGYNTTAFSVNMDTHQVSQAVQLLYPSSYPSAVTRVLALYVLPRQAEEVGQAGQKQPSVGAALRGEMAA